MKFSKELFIQAVSEQDFPLRVITNRDRYELDKSENYWNKPSGYFICLDMGFTGDDKENGYTDVRKFAADIYDEIADYDEIITGLEEIIRTKW